MDLELRDHLETTDLCPDEGEARRWRVRARVLAVSPALETGDFEQITPQDLTRLYEAYDQAFFGDLLRVERLGTTGVLVGLRLSERMTRTAGLTQRRHLGADVWEYDLAFSLPLLWQSFAGEDRPVAVSGRRCTDRLDALQRVFEHELLHLVEFLAYDTSSCKRHRFRYFAKGMFGHTASSHNLVTSRELAWRTKGDCVGHLVEFDHDGRTLAGRVMRIVKRASVRVEIKASDGRVFVRTFYVPLGRLRLLRA